MAVDVCTAMVGEGKEPVWDSLPVYKVKSSCRPDFIPFSQCRFCYDPGQGLFIRLWAFDVLPGPETADFVKLLQRYRLYFMFQPQQGGKYMYFCFTPRGLREGRFSDGTPFSASALEKVSTFQGEDLQGIYWGCQCLIPNTLLQKYFGMPSFEVHSSFRGNVVKLLEEPLPKGHIVSLFQPVLKKEDISNPLFFGDFTLVDY